MARVPAVPSMPDLKGEQKEVFERLNRYFAEVARRGAEDDSEGSRPRLPNVIAVVGERGVGKTTVLEALRQSLEEPHNHGAPDAWFVSTEIIDAATVREDLGLAAAAVDALYQTLAERRAHGEVVGGDPAFTGRGSSSHDRMRELEMRYVECFQSVLLQEDSHRELAQDLAMSPSHYGTIVREAAERKRNMPAAFHELVKALRAAHTPAQRRRPQPHLVVYVDDLDLAPPRLVQSFARSLLREHADADVHWVLTFDRERMVRSLSRPGAGRSRVDVATGNALLTKLVPFHRAHELLPWSIAERRAFTPFAEPGEGPTVGAARPSLGDLLARAALTDLIPLLPPHPRSLESIHRWLLERTEHATSSVDFIRKVLVATGETNFSHQLERTSPARLATRLSWEAGHTIDERGWADLARAGAEDGPIWGFPVPRALRGLTGGLEPEAVVESLLDAALSDTKLSPYPIFQRMAFVRAQFELARVSTAYPEDEIVRYLNEPSPGAASALNWQAWKGAPEVGLWSVSLGPDTLWQTYYGLRSFLPSLLLKELYLPQLHADGMRPSTRAVQADSATALPDPLPRRLRSLVFLVDGLARAPWRQLESIEKLWSPLAMTQAVAALALSAYAWGVWGEHPESEPSDLHAARSGSADALLGLDEAALGVEYRRLLAWLRSSKPPAGDPSPSLLARIELHRALRATLALPSVTAIAEIEEEA